jgi:hypothetical protein
MSSQSSGPKTRERPGMGKGRSKQRGVKHTKAVRVRQVQGRGRRAATR